MAMTHHPEDQAIAERAAQWLGVLENGSPEDRKAFAAWLKESPRHVEEFLCVTALSREFTGFSPEHSSAAAQTPSSVVSLDTSRQSAVPARQPRSRRFVVVTALAASLALVSAWWLLTGQALGWTTYSTDIGEQRAFELADGSLVHLNTRSRLQVRLSDGARRIRLTAGEALFKVAGDPQRPFSVNAGNATVQVLGTQFNVYRREDDTRISVLEGRVDVRGDKTFQVLKGGEETLVTADGSVAAATPADVAAATSWRQRRLVFRTEQLQTIATEFNRYNRSPRIVIPQVEVRTRNLSGVFDADDPESLVQFLTLHGSHNAKDLAQEVYLRLLRIEDAQLVRNPQAYVYRVASHVVYEYKLREEQEQVTFDSEVLEDLGENPAQILPDQLGDRLSSQQQLDELLAVLPPVYRQVFLLQKRDGLSYVEIAAQTGLSVHTVKKYLYRALAAVRVEVMRRKRR